MPLAPKGGAGGAKPVPPSRLGKFKPEPGSNRPAHRCECCGKEGEDVPQHPKSKVVPLQYGLNVLGIMQNNSASASKGDVRFGDHAVNEQISWITRPVGKKRGLVVIWSRHHYCLSHHSNRMCTHGLALQRLQQLRRIGTRLQNWMCTLLPLCRCTDM